MRNATSILALVLLLLPAHAFAQDSGGRIYGKVITQEGDVFEGLIRWDRNEVSWLDILDGSKKIDDAYAEDRKRGGEIRILGVRLRFDDDWVGHSRSKQSGIRFGHLKTLENVGRDRALLTLRDGQQVELHGGSTDIGNDVRGIIVEDLRRGVVELKWRDLDRVEFGPAPRSTTSRLGERLFGTMTTRSGDIFSGPVCWDVDEVLTEDILDGKDERGRTRKIPFSEIAAIERYNNSSSLVTLWNGDEVVLSGTNDVNSSNRGIMVLDPALGQVRVRWAEFERMEFTEPTRTVRYEDFPGSGANRGTLTTRDGHKLRGDVRWDDDEVYAWEFIGGKQNGVSYTVELGLIQEIERISSSAARVTLRDGRTLNLRDSNDVDERNDGIFITLAGGEVEHVGWRDFDRVVFDKP